MKKILINLFSILFLVGISNYATACCGSCSKSSDSTKVEQKSCDKTATKSCCKSKSNTSCSKSKKGSFNFNKNSNRYSKNSSCSKSKAKNCCKKKALEKDNNEENTTEEKVSTEE